MIDIIENLIIFIVFLIMGLAVILKPGFETFGTLTLILIMYWTIKWCET